MNHAFVFTYGLIAYGAFVGSFLYLIGFVGNLVVGKSIDSGPLVPLGQAVFVNVALIALFGLQHSGMARPAFKSWWTRFIPQPIERSTFVLLTSLILVFLFWQWRPIPMILWEATHPVPVALLWALFLLGWAVVLYSSFLIDHFDLFGLRQVYLHLRKRSYSHPPFAVKSLYKLVRHPLMVGILIGIWSTPTMTAGHLLFALLMTGYIFVGVTLEERDLARHLGSDYERYRLLTPMFLPSLPKPKSPARVDPMG